MSRHQLAIKKAEEAAMEGVGQVELVVVEVEVGVGVMILTNVEAVGEVFLQKTFGHS